MTENDRLRETIDALVKALEPFAGDRIPSLRKSEISRNRDGLRCAMSPMEIACQSAREVLSQITGAVGNSLPSTSSLSGDRK